jgi:hypothetical protein
MRASSPVRRAARCARVRWWPGPCCPDWGQGRKAGRPHEAPVGISGQDISDGISAPSDGRAPVSGSEENWGRQPFGWTGRCIIHLQPAVGYPARKTARDRQSESPPHCVMTTFESLRPCKRTNSLPALVAKCTARSQKATLKRRRESQAPPSVLANFLDYRGRSEPRTAAPILSRPAPTFIWPPDGPQRN